MEMAQVAAVLQRIEAGDAPPEHLRRIVLSLDMGENPSVPSENICGDECAVLKFSPRHRAGVDVFPGWRRPAAGRSVRWSRSSGPSTRWCTNFSCGSNGRRRRRGGAVGGAVRGSRGCFSRKLEEVIRSHFGYEETELAEAIGYYLGGV